MFYLDSASLEATPNGASRRILESDPSAAWRAARFDSARIDRFENTGAQIFQGTPVAG
jgi:hypothetical protein